MTAKENDVAVSGRALRWEEHKERTRRGLVESARRLFAEQGFEATSAASIAADAGVTERTLYRYFPTKMALVLDEVFARLPEMFELIRRRPAAEAPYRAVCEGVVEFGTVHRDLLQPLFAAPAAELIPADGRQRTLIDFEDTLAEVLRERYAIPPQDRVSPAVWARASIGALRTALIAANGAPEDGHATKTPVIDTLRTCFAALEAGPGSRRDPAALPADRA